MDFVIELKTPQLDDVRDMLVNFVVQFGGVELDWKEWILIYSQSLLGRYVATYPILSSLTYPLQGTGDP